MTGYKEQCLFFVPVPDLSKICNVFMAFNKFSSERDEGELRNRQVKTCRELLCLYSNVIACPVLGSCGGVSVIMAVNFFQNGIIQAFAQNHSLKIGSPQRVLPSILQMCLSYSLTARLVPSWNKAGLYLIAGMDFLSDAGKRIAVVMELNVNEAEVCVSVEACTIILPPATDINYFKVLNIVRGSGDGLAPSLELVPALRSLLPVGPLVLKDFDVPGLVMKKFLSTRDSVLQTRQPNNWCYILPSMKKGQVVSISRSLPQECPFRSYTELQHHWSSMYGYHLPPLNEDEVVYCSVHFKPLGEKLFTYPLSCIRIHPVQRFPRVNLQGALGTFISDVKSLLDNICGFEVQMTSNPCYHTTNLNRSSLQVSGVQPVNLTTKSSSRPVLTYLPSVIPPERAPLSQLTQVSWPLSQPIDRSSAKEAATTRGQRNPHIPSQILHRSQNHGTDTHQLPSSFNSLTSISSSFVHSNSQPIPQAPKLVPIFKNKLLSRHINVTKILDEKKNQAKEQRLCPSVQAVKNPFFLSGSHSSYSSPSNCPLQISHPPLPRVSLPFFKKLNGKHSTAEQPLTQAQHTAMPKSSSKRAGEVFESHPKKPKVSKDVQVVKYVRQKSAGKDKQGYTAVLTEMSKDHHTFKGRYREL